MLTRNRHIKITKGKTNWIQKDRKKETALKQLQAHNVPTDDVENTNTNQGDVLFTYKPRTVPRVTERMLQEKEQEIYYTLINKSSRRAKRDEKM